MTKKERPLTTITVRPRPGDPARGILRFGPLHLQCALGRAGPSAGKREGDGATPISRMRVLGGYYRGDKVMCRRTTLPLRAISPSAGWCDQPLDRNYNRPVRLPYRASAETMFRNDGLYDICIVLDWNVSRRCQGRGSAIFLHMARSGYKPTEGCIALAPRDMQRLLPCLSRGTVVRVMR